MMVLHEKDRLLLLRHALGDPLTEAEQQRCRQLLDTSEEAREDLRQQQAFRRLMTEGQHQAFAPFFADRAMRRVAQRRVSRRTAQYVAERVWRSGSLLRWAMPALAMILILVYVFGFRPTTMQAPYGATEVVTLSDGSQVTLSSGATLRTYPSFLRSQRKVNLVGEAFFAVEPGRKPFVVETFNATVTVKGTQFNVRAWPAGDVQETTVVVVSGRVEVAAAALPDQVVALERSEGTIVTGHDKAPQDHWAVAVQQALAWRTGGFAFEDQPLGAVLDELERRFDLRLEVSVPLRAHRLNYYNAQPESIIKVLEDICYSLDLRYRRTANGYEVLATD